jgi:hypothetical protein
MGAIPLPTNAPPWRLAVAKEAAKWVGQVGGINQVSPGKWELHGWETLIRIYKEAGETQTTIVSAWTPQIEKGIREGHWIRKAASGNNLFTDVEAEGVAWCGIFAAWVIKNAGYSTYWSSDRKLRSRNHDLVLKVPDKNAPKNWPDLIQTGDVCVLGGNQHHVVIINAKPGEKSVDTVEGNIPFPKRHAIEYRHRNKSEFHTWYQLSDL